jgi:hypothetical protein
MSTPAQITGTQHAVANNGGVAGGGMLRPEDRVTIEVGRDDLSAVVTISPGQPVEVAPADSSDQPTGGWVQYSAGQSFPLGPGDRRVARMVGVGGAGLRVQFAGPGLDVLRNYDGTRGTAG